MIHFFAKLLIKDYSDLRNPAVRRGYGTLCAVMGIVLNVLQSLMKFTAGVLAGSVAIIADGVNNLSDAASSIITLVGFRSSGKHADEDHPFGHGRTEYIAGMIVTVLVMAVGLEILKTSVDKIIHPVPVTPSVVSFVVLGASVLLKLYMYLYNRRYGKKLDSPTLKAVAVDSISDVFVTLVVMIAMAVSKFSSWNVDAYGGLLVGVFVLYMGWQSIWETISPLIGNKPDPAFVKKVRDIVLQQPDILGVHNIMVHSYGHGVSYVVLDVEVPGEMSLIAIHNEVDLAEYRLRKELGCNAVIHMDPVGKETEELKRARESVGELLTKCFPNFELKDIRIVPAKPREKLVFEVYVPVEYVGDESAKHEELVRLCEEALPQYRVRLTLDHEYV